MKKRSFVESKNVYKKKSKPKEKINYVKRIFKSLYIFPLLVSFSLQHRTHMCWGQQQQAKEREKRDFYQQTVPFSYYEYFNVFYYLFVEVLAHSPHSKIVCVSFEFQIRFFSLFFFTYYSPFACCWSPEILNILSWLFLQCLSLRGCFF